MPVQLRFLQKLRSKQNVKSAQSQC
uniref:Uncharacterized protein n=1 Tax=Arundo donax TaxID=35708 RepID=A0A0A9GSR5_ARUDO